MEKIFLIPLGLVVGVRGRMAVRRICCNLVLIAILTQVCDSQTITHKGSVQETAVKITLSAQKEGPAGLFSQVGTDLTDSEIAALRSLIGQKIVGLDVKHELVSENYDQRHLFLSVVCVKFVSDGKTYFAVSSALSIGKVQTTVESLTHDVMVEPSLETTARAVVYYLSAVELRGITGATK